MLFSRRSTAARQKKSHGSNLMPERSASELAFAWRLCARRELGTQEEDFAPRRKDAKIRKDFFSHLTINCGARPKKWHESANAFASNNIPARKPRYRNYFARSSGASS